MISFKTICELCDKLEKTSSRNKKVELVASAIRSISSPREANIACRLILGKLASSLKTNTGFSTFFDALKTVTGISAKSFNKLMLQVGDIGETAQIILEKKPNIQKSLLENEISLTSVNEVFRKISEIKGLDSQNKKKRLVETFLLKAKPIEAKYFTKNLIGDMRHGFADGLMEEAIAKAFRTDLHKIREVHMLTGDLARLCEDLKEGRINFQTLTPTIFHPVKPMLAEMAKSIQEALTAHGGETSFEYKYDGIRVQIHKKDTLVRIFSRRSKDMTNAFPDIVKLISDNVESKKIILDGELIPVNEKGAPMPFQHVMERYGRLKNIAEIAEKVPTSLCIFDLLFINDCSMFTRPYIERRAELETIIPNFLLAPQLTVTNINDATKFFDKAIEQCHEGVVAKRLNSIYMPGMRGKSWLKLKKILETLDLVIVAAEYGYGCRRMKLSDYYLAAKNDEDIIEKRGPFSFPDFIEKMHGGKFKILGKTFKGLTDLELNEMTDKLKKLVLGQYGRTVIVKPEIVVETAFSEVQRSPLYSAGLALRFARIFKIRNDKTLDEIDNLSKAREIYNKQFESKVGP